MDNRVGENVPTRTKLDQSLKALAALYAEMAKFCVTLSPEERSRTLKSRKDSEWMIRTVHELASKKGLNLPGISLDGMLDDLNLGSQLSPFATQVTMMLRLVQDTCIQAEHQAWQAFLAYYAALSSLSTHDPEVSVAMAKVTEAMRPARKKNPAPGKARP